MIVRLVSGKQSDVTVMQSNHVNNRNGLYQTVLHHRKIKKLEGCTFLRLFLQKDPSICIIFVILNRKEGAVPTVHPSMYSASYSGVEVKWIGSFSNGWDNSHFRSVIAYQSNFQWYANSYVHQKKRDNWMYCFSFYELWFRQLWLCKSIVFGRSTIDIPTQVWYFSTPMNWAQFFYFWSQFYSLYYNS